VSINGADHEGDWDRLIQTLDRGAFDVKGFLSAIRSLGYKGPVALQCYAIQGDREENLTRSMRAWRSF
jgi:sugar phosphate isomerase/epimerase